MNSKEEQTNSEVTN